MRFILSLLLISGIAFQSFGKEDYSLTVYETYEDYVNKKGKQLFEFIGYDWTLGSLHLFYRVKKRDERKVKVTTSWGFTIGEQLYRIVKGKPHRVLMQGNIVYYENGVAHMSMLVGGEDEAIVELGDWHFISDNLTSEIIEFPSAKADKEFGERVDLQGLFNCMEKVRKKKTEKIRDCVRNNI